MQSALCVTLEYGAPILKRVKLGGIFIGLRFDIMVIES